LDPILINRVDFPFPLSVTITTTYHCKCRFSLEEKIWAFSGGLIWNAHFNLYNNSA